MDIEKRLKQAVQSYWDAREKNREKQIEGGKIDAGTRGEVTGGSQMGAMEVLVADILCDAGLKKIDVKTRTSLELPGYYRSEKKWDLIVVSEGHLVTAMEFKSQVGPSFGNNFNNRSEEAIGSATDIWVAYREGRFGESPPLSLAISSFWRTATGSRHLYATRSRISRLTGCSTRHLTASATNCFVGGWSSSASTAPHVS